MDRPREYRKSGGWGTLSIITLGVLSLGPRGALSLERAIEEEMKKQMRWISVALGALLMVACGDNGNGGGSSLPNGTAWRLVYSGGLEGEASGGLCMVTGAAHLTSVHCTGEGSVTLSLPGGAAESNTFSMMAKLADGTSCTNGVSASEAEMTLEIIDDSRDSFHGVFSGGLKCAVGGEDVISTFSLTVDRDN